MMNINRITYLILILLNGLSSNAQNMDIFKDGLNNLKSQKLLSATIHKALVEGLEDLNIRNKSELYSIWMFLLQQEEPNAYGIFLLIEGGFIYQKADGELAIHKPNEDTHGVMIGGTLVAGLENLDKKDLVQVENIISINPPAPFFSALKLFGWIDEALYKALQKEIRDKKILMSMQIINWLSEYYEAHTEECEFE